MSSVSPGNRSFDSMTDPSEFRFRVDLLIRVFGMDADSHPFSQKAHAPNISDRGAQLSGLERQLRPGDIIGVQFGDTKARCKVVWFGGAGQASETEAGVKIVEGQPCPWRKRWSGRAIQPPSPFPGRVPAGENKRSFRRLRIPFPHRDPGRAGSRQPHADHHARYRRGGLLYRDPAAAAGANRWRSRSG